MKLLAWSLLLLSFHLASAALDVMHPPTEAQKQTLIAQGWEGARDEIAQSLSQVYLPSRSSLAGSTQNPAFTSWLHLWQWFDLFAKPQAGFLEEYIRQHIFADKDGRLVRLGPGVSKPDELRSLNAEEWEKMAPEMSSAAEHLGVAPINLTETIGQLAGNDFAAVLLADDAFSREFFETVSNRDYVPTVITNLKALWISDPEKFKNYKSLALALAVVFDTPAPAFWPHHQVNPSQVPREQISIEERFAFWTSSNESRRMLLDLRKMNARQLKFVVDALVGRKELEWAQKNVRFPRADFGKAFSSIRYDQQRLAEGKYSWPWQEEYSLAAIRQKGGICVDQAYFAMLSGKALGLPTLFFVGQGNDGGHAWLGYMKSDDRWDMDCGRYINQNYAVGEAIDPQVWEPISDHELSYLAARFRDTPAFSASAHELAMAKMLEKNGDVQKAAKAFDGAISVCPLHAEAWQAKTDFLKRTNATPQIIKTHLEAALQQFKNNEDLRTLYQQELATLARSQGDEKSASAYESQIIQQNRRKRSDISVNTAAGKLTSLMAENKQTEAAAEYRRLISQLGRQSGGNFYYEIVRPYVEALIDAGDQAGAKRALEAAYKALKPEAGSILNKEFAELNEKVWNMKR